MEKEMRTLMIGPEGKQLDELGTPDFAIGFYEMNVSNFIDQEIPAHWHGDLEIFVLDEGMVRLFVRDQEYVLQAGEAYFVNSNILHGLSVVGENPGRYRSIVFDASIIAGQTGSVFDLEFVRPFTEQGGPLWLSSQTELDVAMEVRSAFEQAYAAYHAKAEGYEFDIRAALSKIFLKVRASTETQPLKVPSQQEMRLKQMIAWLASHYQDVIGVEEIAEVAGISVRECQRYFSTYVKMSPIGYLTHLRLTAATELLVSTDLPITEIALACGYKSPSYFTKQFKERVGLSPRDYRQKRMG